MEQTTINTIILLFPLLIGGVIALINNDAVNSFSEKIENWTRLKHKKVANKNAWFSRFIMNPVLWAIVKFFDWTDSMTNRGLKNALRIVAILYFIAAWVLILYTALAFILALAIAILLGYIMIKILVNSNGDFKRNFEKGKRIMGPIGPGKRINQETGVIQEKGIFGYEDTNQRIDPETGKMQTKDIIGWKDTGKKVDQESGRIKKETFLGYQDTETRVHPETGIIQKKGLIGWIDTEERINPETGKHQEKGLFGWIDK